MFNVLGIESLEKEEKDLIEELRVANQELLDARENVVMIDEEKELKESEQPSQPSIRCEDEEDAVEHYSVYESPGELSMGLRQRKTTTNGTGNDSEAIFRSQDTKEVNVSRDDPISKSIIQLLWKAFQYLLIVPKRVIIGKVGSENYKERQKYYGAPHPSDTETGRGQGFVTNTNRPSYAVVTFATRQAAIIARQCLADGSARNRWKQVDQIPIYPLADAPPWAVGRPVTPTTPYLSKKIRRWVVYTGFTVFTIANVYIVQEINSVLLNPRLFSALLGITEEKAEAYVGLASGYTQIAVLSIAPSIFLILANIEGSATSMEKAEQRALIFFWYFFIVARFMGQIVFDAAIKITEGSIENALSEAVTQLALTVPTTLGPSAYFYIIAQCTTTLPLFYFFNVANIATGVLRLNWINRILKGGGSGSEVPYRIYVDSGYVLACMMSLAPLCPLLGPVCLMYFVIVAPFLRWLLVFAYRPKFDGGGDKWPKLHHMIITSMLLGQLTTGISFFLKRNMWEGAFVSLWIIPTLLYNDIILEKFLRPYRDAALLQTSRMYNRLEDPTTSWLEREEYRRWLVDCHKASYLPTCLSGGTKNNLTSEPAVVLLEKMSSTIETVDDQKSEKNRESFRRLLKRQDCQKGGILRRQRFNI